MRIAVVFVLAFFFSYLHASLVENPNVFSYLFGFAASCIIDVVMTIMRAVE